MYIVVIAVLIAIVVAYAAGTFHGTQTEKDKHDEKEIDNLKRACAARATADIERLRKKYKSGSSV